MLLSVSLALAGCSHSPPAGNSPPDDVEITSPSDESGSGDSAIRNEGPFRFSSRLIDTGIDFVHVTGDDDDKPFPAANGSGIATFDYDQDGQCDIYFATGNPFPVEPTDDDASNRLYRNQGTWKYRDRTAATGLGHNGYTAGIAVGDFDNDGFDDVFLNCFGPDRFFHNQGDGTYLDVTESVGVNDERWGTSTVFFDCNADGLLDLYIGNYAVWSLETNQFCGDRQSGHRMFCGPTTVPPELDSLHRNNGDGTFTDISEASGVTSIAGRTQGVLAADLNLDGWLDLYLGNDLNPNSLLINNHDGTFQDHGDLAGAAYDRSGRAQAGMGVTSADVNRDELPDLFVTNFENEHNAFYEQDDAGFFRESAHMRGLAAPSLPWIGWGTTFADFDLDGWHDLIVINGHTDNNLADLGRSGDYDQPPLIWHNRQGQFELVDTQPGEYFRTNHPGRSLALADLDNDNDWDVVCGHQDQKPELLCNDTQRDAVYSTYRLEFVGTHSDRTGVGIVVRYEQEGHTIVEQVVGGGSYLSSSQSAIVLTVPAALTSPSISLQINWPGGRETQLMLDDVPGRYVVVEPHDLHSEECQAYRLP